MRHLPQYGLEIHGTNRAGALLEAQSDFLAQAKLKGDRFSLEVSTAGIQILGPSRKPLQDLVLHPWLIKFLQRWVDSGEPSVFLGARLDRDLIGTQHDVLFLTDLLCHHGDYLVGRSLDSRLKLLDEWVSRFEEKDSPYPFASEVVPGLWKARLLERSWQEQILRYESLPFFEGLWVRRGSARLEPLGSRSTNLRGNYRWVKG